MVDLKTRAEFIIDFWNTEYPRIGFEKNVFAKLPNKVLDSVLKQYDDYCIEGGFCPNCYGNISQPDAMYECLHCHTCGFIKDD